MDTFTWKGKLLLSTARPSFNVVIPQNTCEGDTVSHRRYIAIGGIFADYRWHIKVTNATRNREKLGRNL